MTSQNGEIIKKNANFTWDQVKRNMIYRYRYLETVSDIIQRNEIVKISKKNCFLLISANKDSLRLGIQTYFSWNNSYLSIIL